ncbi:tetratricopeptide repeat protein, partial [Kribbella albertanoniae]
FTPESTAALVETTPPKAGDLLEHLTDLHLLESHTPGRYHFHDLVRAYAHELAQQLPAGARTAAIDHLLALYLGVAWRAADLADPKAARNAWSGRPPVPAFPVLNTSEEALSWIDGELANYLAVIDQSAGLGDRDEIAAGLVIGLYSYFVMRGSFTEWLPAIDQVADGQIDGWTLAQLHADAAIALASAARYEEAAVRFGQARDAFTTIGNVRGVSLATNNTARLLIRMHRYAEALPMAERALAINKQLGDERAMAAAYCTLAEVNTELGNWAAVREVVDAGIELFANVGDLAGIANLRIEGAWARVRSGRSEGAVEDIVRSLSELEALGLRSFVCDAHWILGMSYLVLNEVDRGIEQAELALEIALDADDRRREAQIRLLLGELLSRVGDRDDAAANLESALAFYRQHHPGQAVAAQTLLNEVQNATSA